MKLKRILYLLPSIIAIFMAIFAMVACTANKSENEQSIAEWGTESIIEKRQIVYEKTEIISDNETSYWFVLVQKKNWDAMYNFYISQDHSYFSEKEALSEVGDPDKLFLRNFIKISEATYIVNNIKVINKSK